MSEQSIIDLEIKISHLEVTVEVLQKLVYDQQKALEKLESRVEWLAKREGGGLDFGAGNEKPPHY